MPEKRMLIVDAELIQRIDENRNDMTRVEFLQFLLDSYLKKEARSEDTPRGDLNQFREEIKDLLKGLAADSQTKKDGRGDDFITREELQLFQEGIKDLLRSFLDFFLTYSLEMGKEPQDSEFQQFAEKLQSLDRSNKRR
jgi:hypothetical protein